MNLAAIEVAVGAILRYIDEDSGREGLWRTPERVAEMYTELFSGVGLDPAAEIDAIFSDDVTHDPVLVADLPFYSMCEHHMLPFFGKVHIAYSPNGRVFGVSKMVRLVEKYSRRLQIQERMTRSIANEMQAQGVRGVAVLVEAEHLCMKMRGVRNDARMATSVFRGIYESREEKEAVVAMIRRPAEDI
jgi:GTP cyclohydrolase I